MCCDLLLMFSSLKNGWILNSHGELVASPIVEDNHSMTPTATMPPPSREISTRINNLVNMVHSKFQGTRKEDDDETKMVEPLTVQALQQQEENRRKQEMLIVQTIRGKEIQGHPSYEVSQLVS